MGSVFQKQLVCVGFVFFVTTSVQAMQVYQAAPDCSICLEKKSLMYPYACETSEKISRGHGICEECWQRCVFEHKYGGLLALQCPVCRALVKLDYKLCYVDGCLPRRPVQLIEETKIIDRDTVLDGNVLGYDINFGKRGSFRVKSDCTLFLKNIRLHNIRHGCIAGHERAVRFTLFLQNVEIIRSEDYFFPDALVYPGFLRVDDVPIIWFKNPREFSDRHLRNVIRGLTATPVPGPANK